MWDWTGQFQFNHSCGTGQASFSLKSTYYKSTAHKYIHKTNNKTFSVVRTMQTNLQNPHTLTQSKCSQQTSSSTEQNASCNIEDLRSLLTFFLSNFLMSSDTLLYSIIPAFNALLFYHTATRFGFTNDAIIRLVCKRICREKYHNVLKYGRVVTRVTNA